MRSRKLIPLLLLLLSGLDLAGGASAGGPPHAGSKLEGALFELLATDSRGAPRAQSLGIEFEEGRVHAVIELDGGNSRNVSMAQLQAWGARIISRSPRRVSAWIPVDRLRDVAGLPGVRFVRRPFTSGALQIPYETGALPTGALLLQSYGIRGRGATVAVIDQGFAELGLAYRRGEIAEEAVVSAIDYSGDGLAAGGTHGTRVARIVHEMAPQASLVLMNLGPDGDEVALEQAVGDAIEMGVDIINHSLGWFDTNFGDGSGPIDAIARRASEAGILWVNAAGNQAQRHWTGRFRDRDGDGWAELGSAGEELTVWAGFGGAIQLALIWDDWPDTRQDFDLYLYNWRGEQLAAATAPQRGYDPPREILTHIVEQPGVFTVKIRARRVTRPIDIKIFSLEHEIAPAVPYGSIVAPADCACALAVGAVNVRQWDSGIVERFSARGPTSDGRIKPDLVAPDGVRRFYGTSASAPSVSGAAALLLSGHPEWGAEELRRALIDGARDMGPPGADVASGAGRLRVSAGEPEAIRTLSESIVRPGEEITVRLEARMPAGQFGSVKLVEALPPGFSLQPLKGPPLETVQTAADGADRTAYRWTLGAAGPGPVAVIVYRLRVGDRVAPGLYRIEGRVEGRPIGGGGEIRVRSEPGALGRGFRVTARYAPEPGTGAIHFLRRTALGTAAGQGMDERLPSWKVRLYDASGRLLGETDFVSGRHVMLVPDARLASGVYLYVVVVRGPDGELTLVDAEKVPVRAF